jgi:hypothetical protein
MGIGLAFGLGGMALGLGLATIRSWSKGAQKRRGSAVHETAAVRQALLEAVCRGRPRLKSVEV